jgi:peptidoglycan-associated lipoprotein
MKTPTIRTMLALGLLALPAAHAFAAPRVQSALERAAATQPRDVPKAPDTVAEFATTPALRPIRFDFARANIRPADRALVDANARWLVANPDYDILIAGYADPRGTASYNLALAQRRAARLRDELVARGVRPERIAVVTYGEGVPACRVATERCWARDRAADILVRARTPQTP